MLRKSFKDAETRIPKRVCLENNTEQHSSTQTSGFAFDFDLGGRDAEGCDASGDEPSTAQPSTAHTPDHGANRARVVAIGTTTSETEANIISHVPKGKVPIPQQYGVVRRSVMRAGGFSVQQGQVVKIDWEHSNHFELYCHTISNQQDSHRALHSSDANPHQSQAGGAAGSGLSSGFIPAKAIALLAPPQDAASEFAVPAVAARNTPTVRELDSVFAQASSLVDVCESPLGGGVKHSLAAAETAMQQQQQDIQTPQKIPFAYAEDEDANAAPIAVDFSLDSFIWPMSREQFLDEVFQRQCFVVHATGQRLDNFKQHLADFNVEEMLQQSQHVIVWMKDARKDQMHYVEANPQIGATAYAVGHSLYFNPEPTFQEKLVKSLARDLGYDFGADVTQGGGDVEVFAVNKPHSTPWHFDAQENFSIQIRGVKRWSVVPAHLVDPVSNLHPSSSNIEALQADIRAHSIADSHVLTEGPLMHKILPKSSSAPVDLDKHPACRTFVVRPGSVFYHPAGYWHKVDALDDEGSLSINVSLDTLRWSDLFAARIKQIMFSLPALRSRVQFPPVQPQLRSVVNSGAARGVPPSVAIAEHLLGQLKSAINQLEPQDLVPPALLMDGRPFNERLSSGSTTGSQDGEEGEGEPALIWNPDSTSPVPLEFSINRLARTVVTSYKEDLDALVPEESVYGFFEGITGNSGDEAKDPSPALQTGRFNPLVGMHVQFYPASAAPISDPLNSKRSFVVFSGIGTAGFSPQYLAAITVNPKASDPIAQLSTLLLEWIVDKRSSVSLPSAAPDARLDITDMCRSLASRARRYSLPDSSGQLTQVVRTVVAMLMHAGVISRPTLAQQCTE